jgi:transposase
MLWNSDWGRVASKTYSDYILPLVVNSIYEKQKLTFQQDDASTHTAKLTRSTLSYNGIDPMPWPADSPDLNPIETIWHRIKMRLRARHDAPHFLEDL